jgi:hypothetical protein
MKNCDPTTVLQIMRQTIRDLAESRAISLRNETDPAMFFGFRPEDVAGIHTRKSGVGGVGFRLKDGRVFNRYGGIDDPVSR